MRRRRFIGTCTAVAFNAAAALPLLPSPSGSRAAAPEPPLSVMLWTIEPKLTFDQRVAKVAEAGYQAVELVQEYKGWSPADFAHARQRFRRMSMVVDACSGIEASLIDPAQRELLLQQVRTKLVVLAELECSRLILLTGNCVPGLTREQMHSNGVETLKRTAELAASQNVELLLETIDPVENPRYFLTSVAEGFEMVREVNHPRVRLLYDFFHEQIAEGNLIVKLERNLEWIGLVHVADVPGRHAPGTGEINYANVLRKLGQLGYSRYIAMEFLPVGDTVDELRAAREFAEKHFAEGRRLTS